jgi:hypothetical protein
MTIVRCDGFLLGGDWKGWEGNLGIVMQCIEAQSIVVVFSKCGHVRVEKTMQIESEAPPPSPLPRIHPTSSSLSGALQGAATRTQS